MAVGLTVKTGKFGGGPFFQLFAHLKATVLSQQEHGAPQGAALAAVQGDCLGGTYLMIYIMYCCLTAEI